VYIQNCCTTRVSVTAHVYIQNCCTTQRVSVTAHLYIQNCCTTQRASVTAHVYVQNCCTTQRASLQTQFLSSSNCFGLLLSRLSRWKGPKTFPHFRSHRGQHNALCTRRTQLKAVCVGNTAAGRILWRLCQRS